MYSIVMMTALTAAPDAPQFNGFFRDLFNSDSNSCNGCNGCSGGARYSCSGGSSCCGSSAYSTSCSGCSGSSCCGGVFGWGLGERMRSWFERDPSGCCGSRGYSCSGASYSCSGYSCSGYSYCPPYPYSPNQGGYPYPAPPTFDTFPAPGVPTAPGIPYAVPDPAPGMSGWRAPGQSSGALASNAATARASVIVKLPTDARLYADDRALKLTGAERKFVSPELPTGQEFVYRFRVEYERDGVIVSVTKKVAVQAGLTAAVEFSDLTVVRPAGPTIGTPTANGADRGDKGLIPTVKPVVQEPLKTEPPIRPAPAPVGDFPAGAGGDRATITVKLPPGATLYVDDRKSPSQELVRSFSTPPLPAGREFAYLIKAELVRNGQPESFTQKVPFRAGERVVVDFTSLSK